ncbi:ABC transporter permease [Jiangella mangrovi]|uniref:Peptide/nickel transport system permease protein n=1 Tax=Jiangella mangrovi TaxID=1524084 RepID=A0A7W9GY64_9ACTN|nr:ABC transporter permease [Jiangella mangrovi]MBB5791826.1 peptide/nickel transport system permease protein [Jiangella mangrovi]
MSDLRLDGLTDQPPAVTASAADAVTGAASISPRRAAVRRFLRNRLAAAGLVFLVLATLAAIFAPLLAPHDPNAVDLQAYQQPPGGDHLLGTDSSGRDILSRVLYGARVSLTIGIVAALSAAALGLALGLLAGYLGRWVDGVVMRLVEIVLSFPALIPIILVITIVGPSMTTIVVVIAVFEWGTACRVTRALTMSLKEQDLALGTRALGAGSFWLVRKHILRPVLSPLTVVVTLLSAGAIQLEAALSFLGLGVRPPQASWGGMLNEAQSLTILEGAPWMWVFPGLAIILTVLSLNFVGDGLRDALDPRQKR